MNCCCCFPRGLRICRDGEDVFAVPQSSGNLWDDGRKLLGWSRSKTIGQSAQGRGRLCHLIDVRDECVLVNAFLENIFYTLLQSEKRLSRSAEFYQMTGVLVTRSRLRPTLRVEDSLCSTGTLFSLHTLPRTTLRPPHHAGLTMPLH